MEDNLIDMVFEDSISGYVDDETCDIQEDFEPSEDMDGDFESAMTSAGFGVDESYEHNLCDDNGVE